MTDTPPPDPFDELLQSPSSDALPMLVSISAAFNARLPSQRVLDLLAKIEGLSFGDLASQQPFRIVAFRALLRDFPQRDPTSLWMHAYDVEVQIEDLDPTSGGSLMPVPPSVTSGT